MNIDFTDNSISYEARPHRNLWIGVLLSAFEEAISNKPNKDNQLHRDWKYQALDWWYDAKYTEDRKAVFALAGQDFESWLNRLTRTIMHKNMEDHITDSPHTPDDDPEEYIEPIEDLYERYRQDDIDELNETLKDIGNGRL